MEATKTKTSYGYSEMQIFGFAAAFAVRTEAEEAFRVCFQRAYLNMIKFL